MDTIIYRTTLPMFTTGISMNFATPPQSDVMSFLSMYRCTALNGTEAILRYRGCVGERAHFLRVPVYYHYQGFG